MIGAEQTIIFSDLDGTLLDHFTYDYSPARSTLDQLKVANIPIVLSTSKTFAEVNLLQKKLSTSGPLIIENGAAIYIPKTTFTEQPLGTEDKGEYWLKSFCLPIKHWLHIINNTPERYKKFYRGFSSLSTAALVELTDLTEGDAELAKKRQYGEPLYWLGDDNAKQDFIAHLKKSGASILQGGRFLHVSGDCNKGKALTWLAEQYQAILPGEKITTIALGDGENDSAMLEAATIAVQVRSPVHPFPLLSKPTMLIRTTQFGPAGWAEAIQNLLSIQLSSGLKSNAINQEVNHG